jgi:transketolase
MMQTLTDEKIEMLTQKANDIRQSIIKMLVEAGSGHTAGPLGMADIFTALYFYIMHHDPQNLTWKNRDRLILSNGHICPVLYATMAHAGYLPVEELQTLRKFGSKLQGHPHREYFSALETSSGPLGSGLSQAVGMALADRLDNGVKSPVFFYTMLGDGELNEGQVWEAVLHAGKEKLRNIIAIVDRNNIQIDGYTEDIMPLEPLADKWRAFNWHVQEIDGHNFQDIISAVGEAQAVFDRPSVIIAHTIPGKGVKMFENDYKWHGMPPNKEQGALAIEELKKMNN